MQRAACSGLITCQKAQYSDSEALSGSTGTTCKADAGCCAENFSALRAQSLLTQHPLTGNSCLSPKQHAPCPPHSTHLRVATVTGPPQAPPTTTHLFEHVHEEVCVQHMFGVNALIKRLARIKLRQAGSQHICDST